MDYMTTYPNSVIQYYASDMLLHVDSNAAYLVAPDAKFCTAGYYYLSDFPNPLTFPKQNASYHII